MFNYIECDYNQLPAAVRLPEGIQRGLYPLWDKSTETRTEWVAALLHSADGYEVLPLGHQARSGVAVPIVDLFHSAVKTGSKIDADFVHRESQAGSNEIRQILERGSYYEGVILYLLPHHILHDQPELMSESVIPSPYIVRTTEEFLGTAHLHLRPGPDSHLPSITDIRRCVLGRIHMTLEMVVSYPNVSLWVRTKKTPNFQYNPNRHVYLFHQELADKIQLQNGQSFLEVLQKNCSHYKLGLYGGGLDSGELSSYFKNLP